MDILTLLTFVWPEVQSVFPRDPKKLLIVGAGDPMWRGGLSGPNSLYMHADRPLVSENGTSSLVHELVHVFSRISDADRSDWISEGLAEYYAIELMRRAGGMSEEGTAPAGPAAAGTERAWLRAAVQILAFALAAFHIWTAYFGPFYAISQRAFHVGVAMALTFLTVAPLKRELSVVRADDVAEALGVLDLGPRRSDLLREVLGDRRRLGLRGVELDGARVLRSEVVEQRAEPVGARLVASGERLVAAGGGLVDVGGDSVDRVVHVRGVLSGATCAGEELAALGSVSSVAGAWCRSAVGFSGTPGIGT